MAFLDEVAQHGKVLRDLIEFYRGGSGADLLTSAARAMSRRPRSLTFTGMGTSEFAPLIIRDYLGDKCPYHVPLLPGGPLFRDHLVPFWGSSVNLVQLSKR